ncbi:MAG: DUF2846 domain-containing protein [Burkholderiaceae bacterium]
MNRRSALSLVALTAMLQACATPAGPTFSALEPTPAGRANLYIYRKAALYAMAAKYPVTAADKTMVGELYNASYLLLPLKPGKHAFTVAEGGWASPKTFEVDVEAGKNYFVEYDSSKGLLLGAGLLSGTAIKTEAQALADLKELRRAN